jgi:hypothetical protein
LSVNLQTRLFLLVSFVFPSFVRFVLNFDREKAATDGR